MRHRATWLLIALLFVSGLTVGSISPSFATNHNGPTQLHFPWVPNGAMLGESGPYHGTLTIQNLESDEIRIFPSPLSELGGAEPPILRTWTLGPHASITLSPADIEIGGDASGSGVTVSGEFVDDGEPARIAGVQKQSAAEPPSSDARTGSNHRTVDGYAGLSSGDIGTSVVLPIVQTNNGWNTVIRVTNFDQESSANTVRVALREAGGGSAPVVFTEVLGVGETGSFDLLARGIPPEWVGSAVITADSSVGAVAERVKPVTNMLIINQSRPSSSGGYLAPLVLREWNNWNTGISVVNLSDDQNDVTIDYYSLDGELVDSDQLTVPPRGMNFVFTPAGVAGDSAQSTGFVGSANISSIGPVHAAVDEVKYLGDDQDTGHAMSYIAEQRPGNDNYLLVPLVQKGDPVSGLGDTTGIQIAESLGGSATIKIWFLDQLGNIVSPAPEVITLGPREGRTVYAMFYDYLPSGFQGSALVRIVEGQATAISNNVNYSVQYDGSSSMNPTLADDLHSAVDIAISADPNPVPYFSRTSTVSARVTDRFGEPFPSGWAVVFSLEDASQVGLNFGPGAPYASSGPRSTDDTGTATIDVHIREEALGDRPVEAIVTASVGDIEEQITVTWQPQPEVQLPGP